MGTKTVHYCDKCQKEFDLRMTVFSCPFCKKELCSECMGLKKEEKKLPYPFPKSAAIKTEPEITATGKPSCATKQVDKAHPLADFRIHSPEPGTQDAIKVTLDSFEATDEKQPISVAVIELIYKCFGVSAPEASEYIKGMPPHPNRDLILGILQN